MTIALVATVLTALWLVVAWQHAARERDAAIEAAKVTQGKLDETAFELSHMHTEVRIVREKLANVEKLYAECTTEPASARLSGPKKTTKSRAKLTRV